jgi:hypothetical protein
MSFVNDLTNSLSSGFSSLTSKAKEGFDSVKNAVTPGNVGGRRTKRRGLKRRRRVTKYMRGGSTVQSYESAPGMANVGSSYMLGSQSAGRRRRRRRRTGKK